MAVTGGRRPAPKAPAELADTPETPPVNFILSSLGGWLRVQSRRPGAPGQAASAALHLVHGSAVMVGQLGDQVARATETRPPRAKSATRPAARPRKPAGSPSRIRRIKPED